MVIFATVTNVSGGKVFLKVDGEQIARQKGYKYLKSYTPSANDRVACVENSNTLLVLGKI